MPDALVPVKDTMELIKILFWDVIHGQYLKKLENQEESGN